MSIERICQTCVYWHRIAETSTGDCRAEPPQLNVQTHGGWPCSLATDWCGRWKHFDEAGREHRKLYGGL
jgi:hypothetical protein